MPTRCRRVLPVVVVLLAAGRLPLPAAVGEVRSQQKISDTEGDFTGGLSSFDYFAFAAVSSGDLDGDGVADLIVGAPGDDDGALGAGAVWILYLRPDGTVKSHAKISGTEGGFAGPLEYDDAFGVGLADLGDLDGDGVGDIAVGAVRDDDGGTDYGAVWLLFLHANGTVKAQQKISATEGGFTGALETDDRFCRPASLGDVDGDGVGDLAVGAYGDDDGGPDRGAVWILFLNSDGSVRGHQKISETSGGFGGTVSDIGRFGQAVAGIGDLDGDLVPDLAVGVPQDDDGGEVRGAVWVLFLQRDGTVKAEQKISSTQGDFPGPLHDVDRFGTSVAALPDIDHDGVIELAVGAASADLGGSTWVLFLKTDGTVRDQRKIGAGQGGFTGTLSGNDGFGVSIAPLGDLDGDGVVDLAVGATGDGDYQGAEWILFLDGCGDGQVIPGEECDDGNQVDGDGCDTNCTPTGCGNGVVTAGEVCDDGNDDDECDGCSTSCTLTDVCGTLYDQTDLPSSGGVPDQDFEAIYSLYDSEAADDFVISFPTGWDITALATRGSSSGPSQHVNITFYPDQSGRPADSPLCEFLGLTTYDDDQGDLAISLPAPCHLAPGTYWIAQEVRQDFYPNGQRFWSTRLVQAGHQAVWRNPGDEFGTGCLDWDTLEACGVGSPGPDMLFELEGRAQLGSSPVPAVGPFGLLLAGILLGSAGFALFRRR